MRISTKITLGFSLLLGLLVTALSYQVSRVYHVQAITRRLSDTSFRSAAACLRLLRDLDDVEEFTRKFLVTRGDPGYAARLHETREAFSQQIDEVRSFRLSPRESRELERLANLWKQFAENSARLEEMDLPRDPRQIDALLKEQPAAFGALRDHIQGVIRATQLAIQAQADESAREGERAERVSRNAAIAALVISLVVSLWIAGSISRPLRRLAAGTQAVAQGNFSYRLAARGRDELSQLARDFNVMTRRLSQIDEMKKDFVAHVSHELKGPLVSMQETIRLLLDRIPGPLTEQQARLLELNLRSCGRLFSLIANLLDLSRMEAGVMEYDFRTHDLAALVRTVLAECEIQAAEKNVRLEPQLPDAPVPVECDGDRIIQVIGNVVGNAVKFSRAGSAVLVRLSHLANMPGNLPENWRHRVSDAADNAGFALLSVLDSGPGVPPGEQQKIFEKFHQVKQAKNIAQGAGLGLAIGRIIVEAHHGAVWMEDNRGGGSVFHVLLAAGVAAPQAAPRVSAAL